MGPSLFSHKSIQSLHPATTNPQIPRGALKSSSPIPRTMAHCLHEILCLPHGDPAIPEQISTLPSSMRKRSQGLHLKGLSATIQGLVPEQKVCASCLIHEQLAAAPLNHLTALIGFELHTHTQALHALHPATRTEVTNAILQKLHSWHSSTLFQPGNIISGCLACALTCFFNDKDAVRALAIVARSGHKKGKEQVQIIREGWLGLKGQGSRKEAHEVTKDRKLGKRRGFSNGGAEP